MTARKSQRQRVRLLILIVSWLLFPITIFYFSPALIFEGTAIGVINGSMITFGLLFLGSLLLGRAYCGWLCPGAGIQEALLGVKATPTPGWLPRLKWVIWFTWIGGLLALAISVGGYQGVDPWLGIEAGVSLTHPLHYLIYLIVTGLIVLSSVLAGRRGFCHSLCWMAPFMIIGRKLSNFLHLPGLRLQAEAARCTGCTACSRNCPMSLDVHQMVQSGNLEHSACILCGTCVDGCSRDAIKFTFAPPARTSNTAAAESLQA